MFDFSNTKGRKLYMPRKKRIQFTKLGIFVMYDSIIAYMPDVIPANASV